MKKQRKIGGVQGCLEKELLALSGFLQQKTATLTRRQGKLLLAVFVFVGIASCTAVIRSSLQHPDKTSWKVTPIRAFPLPPAGGVSQRPGRTGGSLQSSDTSDFIQQHSKK